jgi:hypothetical protein
MNSKNFILSQYILILIGLAAGVLIAAVDNFAFQGEVSPIVIVGMLLVLTATSGIIWDWNGWFVAAAAWICIPLAHLIKHLLDLPDTLNPNTYTSILMLAVFTFIVSTIGIVSGVFLRRHTTLFSKSKY